jgi:ubiquinone/menaquinone biosynthesis C-methylase UbiE
MIRAKNSRRISPYLDPQLARYYAKASAPHQFIQPARDLVQYLTISAGDKVLDIGSGTGLIASAASEVAGIKGVVFAFDSSLEMLRQQRSIRIIRVVGDAQDLPFNNETFDRIAAGFVITHLKDYKKGLSEWTRVLRPGGILAATAWEIASTTVSEIWKSTLKEFVDLNRVEKEFARVIPWDEFFSVQSNLIKSLEEAGLIEVKAKTNTYRMSMNLNDYIDTKMGSVEGTIARDQIRGETWNQFVTALTNNLKNEFPQRIEYTRNVHLVSGQKP